MSSGIMSHYVFIMTEYDSKWGSKRDGLLVTCKVNVSGQGTFNTMLTIITNTQCKQGAFIMTVYL